MRKNAKKKSIDLARLQSGVKSHCGLQPPIKVIRLRGLCILGHNWGNLAAVGRHCVVGSATGLAPGDPEDPLSWDGLWVKCKGCAQLAAPVSGPTSRDIFGASGTNPSLSKSVRNRFEIGSNSVRIRFEIGSKSVRGFEIGSKSVRNRSGGSKSVRNRFEIGSKSVRNRFEVRFEIGSKSVLEVLKGVAHVKFFMGSLRAPVCVAWSPVNVKDFSSDLLKVFKENFCVVPCLWHGRFWRQMGGVFSLGCVLRGVGEDDIRLFPCCQRSQTEEANPKADTNLIFWYPACSLNN